MATLVTADLVRAFFASAKTLFDDAFQAQAGVHRTIATIVPSTLPEEQYGWIGAVPAMREFLDERTVVKLTEYGFALKNRKYEATLSISRDVLEDEQHGQVRLRVQQMAEAASQHYDRILFELVNGGSTKRCYDGKSFYSASHPSAGATVSNMGSDPLNESALEAAMTAMSLVTLDNGEPMQVMPTHLLVHPSKQIKARQLLQSAWYPETVLATPGQPSPFAANPLNGMLELVVSPRVGSPDAWHLLDCSHAVKPFLIQQRIAPEFYALGDTDVETERSFLRDEYLFGVRSRDSAGYGLWQYAYFSTGEGA